MQNKGQKEPYASNSGLKFIASKKFVRFRANHWEFQGELIDRTNRRKKTPIFSLERAKIANSDRIPPIQIFNNPSDKPTPGRENPPSPIEKISKDRYISRLEGSSFSDDKLKHEISVRENQKI